MRRPSTWTTKGLRLKMTLLERGLTQKEAATLLRMPLSTFNMKLLGKRKFTQEERERLARLLGKEVHELFPVVSIPSNRGISSDHGKNNIEF